MTLSSSRIDPFDSFNAFNSDFSRCLNFSLNSPCNFSRSDRFSSTSGRSDFRTVFRHWLCSELLVTVKFTNVTRLHKSGGNSTVGSRVERKIANVGDKSISWSPIVIKTRPPVRRTSRFRTGFKIGS